MLPFAKANNLRLVFVNRRDYPGSTPLNPEELASVKSESATFESKAAYLCDRGLEIAGFLAWYLRNNTLPPVKTSDTGAKTGGLALIAWSSGNSLALALFGNLDAVPRDQRELIEPYLLSYIFFGA